jgi:heat shock protein HtpX
VIAHELGHVLHRDILISSVAATLAAAISFVGRMAFFFGGRRDDEDERGVQSVPMDDPSPATAHLFIMNPFRAGFLAGLFSTHPATEQRIARLQAMRH